MALDLITEIKVPQHYDIDVKTLKLNMLNQVKLTIKLFHLTSS